MVLSRLFGRRGAAATPLADAAAFDPPRPVRPTYAVGDIHGRVDLLDRITERIAADAADAGLDGARRVFLGDYVDRGEDSRAVLDRLIALSKADPDAVVCLAGNHEQMLLEFVDTPEDKGVRWLRNGGLQTLASFSVSGISGVPTPEMLTEAAGRFAEALGPDRLAWLRARPLHFGDGNVNFIHAGADPARPINAQDAHTLTWGHPDFGIVPRSDGQWIVHGHTIVDAPFAAPGQICVDTGAFFSGRLTAVRLADGDVEFLST